MPTLEEVRGWIGVDLIGHGDERLGTISEVYLDEADRLSFLSVRTSLFGMKSTLVPIGRASQHGDHVHVPYTKEQVKDAPNVHDNEELSDAEEERLYRHYSLEFTAQYEGTSDGSLEGVGAAPTSHVARPGSEQERLVSGSPAPRRARLRRYVHGEDASTTAHRSREEVTIEREPGSATTSPTRTSPTRATKQDRTPHQ